MFLKEPSLLATFANRLFPNINWIVREDGIVNAIITGEEDGHFYAVIFLLEIILGKDYQPHKLKVTMKEDTFQSIDLEISCFSKLSETVLDLKTCLRKDSFVGKAFQKDIQ